MTVDETSRSLWAACVKAGVDPVEVFQHFDARDLEAYREQIDEPGGIAVDMLHKWMQSTAQTIKERRCLCTACKTRRANALVQADPALKICPSCRGACTSCGHCYGRGAVAA